MKNLGNLHPAEGSNKNTKRLGRGPGSGQGKTAGKGHKGQKARKGGGIAPGFEGGQTPLYRRLPKYGFTNARNKKSFHLINLTDLNVFNEGDVVDKESIVKMGLLRKVSHGVKLLANGALEKKLVVKVEKVSKTAKEAVEKMGGSVEEI